MKSARIGSSLLSLAVVILVPLIGSGQQKPSFAGTWTQIDPPLSSGWSRVLRVEQQGNELRVRLESQGQGGSMGFIGRDDNSYTIGRPVESKRNAEGQLRTVAVSWEGSTLVFTRTTRVGDRTSTERETWSLSEDGTKLEQTRWRGAEERRIVLEKR